MGRYLNLSLLVPSRALPILLLLLLPMRAAAASVARRTFQSPPIGSRTARAAVRRLRRPSAGVAFVGGGLDHLVMSHRGMSTAFRPALHAAAATGEDIKASFGPDKKFVGTDVEGAMEALANADAVAFDVDSTVIQEEGIDVLAESLGKGDEVAAWTLKAMEGDTKFEDALAARLDIIRPSRSDIEKCLRDYPLRLSPGIEELIEALNENGTDVYLISGGFRIMIEPLARQLCVARTNIVANTILFDSDGNYAGFCPDEPTSRDMGKPAALQRLKEEHEYDTMVMVGDGATDMQARPTADAFVGFGGVAVRDPVKEGACWFVEDFHDMIDIVKKFGKRKLVPGP